MCANLRLSSSSSIISQRLTTASRRTTLTTQTRLPEDGGGAAAVSVVEAFGSATHMPVIRMWVSWALRLLSASPV